jgi:hypothetical protein
MFKRIGISMALLAGLMAFATPRKANAEVHFGVYVGTPAPVYSYRPAYPSYSYGYDSYSDYYSYPAPVYSYPAPVYSYGYRDNRSIEHQRHEMRERLEHQRHEMREHGRGWRR